MNIKKVFNIQNKEEIPIFGIIQIQGIFGAALKCPTGTMPFPLVIYKNSYINPS